MRRHLLMCLILFLITCGVAPITASGQFPADSIDIVTYNLFMQGNYNELLDVAKRSVRSGTDFFYLRLRMGIVYYNRKNYREAIKHFQKAYSFNAYNVLNNEYLYFAFLLSGRYDDAYQLACSFSEALKQKISFREKPIETLHLSVLYGSNNDHNSSDRLTDTNLYGQQYVARTLIIGNAGAHHKIASRVSFSWDIRKILKYDYSSIMHTDISELNENDYSTQNILYLNAGYLLWHGLHVNISGSFINSAFFEKTNSSGFGRNADASTNRIASNMFSANLGTSKDIGAFSIGFSSNISNFSDDLQYTQTLYATYYPFGNLNMYISGTSSLHTQKKASDTYAIIYSGLCGYKLFNHLWNEWGFMFGDIANYSSDSYYLYNEINPVNYIATGSLIFPFQKYRLYIQYSYVNSTSIFHPTYSETMYENKIIYSTSNIKGGLLWIF